MSVTAPAPTQHLWLPHHLGCDHSKGPPLYIEAGSCFLTRRTCSDAPLHGTVASAWPPTSKLRHKSLRLYVELLLGFFPAAMCPTGWHIGRGIAYAQFKHPTSCLQGWEHEQHQGLTVYRPSAAMLAPSQPSGLLLCWHLQEHCPSPMLRAPALSGHHLGTLESRACCHPLHVPIPRPRGLQECSSPAQPPALCCLIPRSQGFAPCCLLSLVLF